MGFSITAKDKGGTSILATFHYPESDKDRPLYKVLGVGYLKDNKEVTRVYSKGNILQAKSELVGVSNVLPENDFLDTLIVEFLINPNTIQITFN